VKSNCGYSSAIRLTSCAVYLSYISRRKGQFVVKKRKLMMIPILGLLVVGLLKLKRMFGGGGEAEEEA